MPTDTIEKEILKDVLNNPGDTFYENVLSDFLDEQGIEHDFRNPLYNNFVTELKPYQKKCLDIWKNHWIDIGLCTKPTNEDKAEQYFYNLYKEFGLKKPKSIIWFDNPIEMFRQTYNRTSSHVFNQEWNWVLNRAWNRVSNKTSNQVWNHVWNQVSGQVWHKVWYQTWDQVWTQVSNQISNQVSNQTTCRVWWQQDAHWLAHCSYFMQVLRMEAVKQITPFNLLVRQINWWFPTEQTILVTRKPKECVIKDGKLVKLVYQDGYTVQ
jgi:hypothetical protein